MLNLKSGLSEGKCSGLAGLHLIFQCLRTLQFGSTFIPLIWFQSYFFFLSCISQKQNRVSCPHYFLAISLLGICTYSILLFLTLFICSISLLCHTTESLFIIILLFLRFLLLLTLFFHFYYIGFYFFSINPFLYLE